MTSANVKWIAVTLILIVVIVLVLRNEESAPMPEPSLFWQERMRQTMVDQNIPNKYLEETDYFNYNNEVIQGISEELLAQSRDARHYTQLVLEYVYQNVRYDFYETDKTCFDSCAVTVLERGTGQCDTMSMPVVALLRAGGVPSYAVGGCIYRSPSLLCDMEYSVFGAREPKYRDLSIEDFPELLINETGIGRAGGLHAWVRAHTGERFQLLEVTTGEIVERSCYVYVKELIVENHRQLCVSDDVVFAIWCARQ